VGLKNWFSRRKTVSPAPAAAAPRSTIEPLEGRTLLAAAVATSMYADNRGAVYIRFDKDLQASTVTRTSAKILLPGADKTLGTSDDQQVTANVSYNKSKKTVQILADVPVDSGYRVKLYSSRIKDIDGFRIDGEFTGMSHTGNGVQGGDLEFRVRRDTGATPRARFNTNMGDIDITLFRGDDGVHQPTPNNVALFLRYVNGGEWDNMFVTRNAKNFVTQLGGLRLGSTGSIEDVPGPTELDPAFTKGDLAEQGNSNIRGSVAYALSGGPQTASNEFFFNLANNNGTGTSGNLDDTSSGGGPFVVFGRVNSHGLKVLDAINALHRVNASNPNIHVDLQNLPVKNLTVTGETDGAGGTTNDTLNPKTDLVVVSRGAVLMKILSLT
jgi:cyclophilin family peptidyl-prolyl cis-trans isomerase